MRKEVTRRFDDDLAHLLPGAEPAVGAEGRERPRELHASLPKAPVKGVRRRDLDGKALRVKQGTRQGLSGRGRATRNFLVVFACSFRSASRQII